MTERTLLRCPSCNDDENQDSSIKRVPWLNNIPMCNHCRRHNKVSMNSVDNRERCRFCLNLLENVQHTECPRGDDGNHELLVVFKLDRDGFAIPPRP